MKRWVSILMVIFLLTGCSGEAEPDGLLQLRQQLQTAQCSFSAVVTADYGDKTYSFSMDCESDGKGNLSFTVTEPESIAGISGKIEKGEGALVFDDVALAFELLTDDQLSPISAPWILIKTLRSGFLRSSGQDGAFIRATLMDSYEADALMVDVWLEDDRKPVQAEILWKDRRILTIEVKDFVIS